MPVFKYRALDIKGKTFSGIMDAESAFAARRKLRQTNTYPISIDEIKHETKGKKTRYLSISNRLSRVSPSEIAMMTRQLATLVEAGLPLVSAIDALTSHAPSYTFKSMMAQIKDDIVAGSSFAVALEKYPDTFSSIFISMVQAGETSGTLELVLERLADITEKQEALKNRIRSAMAYPAFMSIIGVLVLFFLLAYIVPGITSIFEDMNQVLPTMTIMLINIHHFLKSYWWLFLIIAGSLFFCTKAIGKTANGRYFLDKTRLLIPVAGMLIVKMAAARIARTLGSLLENGVSMLTALDIVKNITGNEFIKEWIEKASKEVGQGQSLAAALNDSGRFPDLFIQMIAVGEQSGRLETMLSKVSDVFEKELESKIMRATTLLEPVMILMMGVVIGFIVLSICLPIFQMNQLVL
jgi:general secretion pathway protein F